MEKVIYLVRHAQSEYNEKGIFQGRLDSDLTPLGFVQARLLAKEFKGKDIEVIYTSPQRRAYKTALTLSDILSVELIVDERVREMSFGEFEGKPFLRMVEEYKETFLNWLANPLRNPLPTQESMEEFEKRVRSFMEEVLQNHYRRVIVVAHGGSLHAMVCLALGLGLENLWSIHMDNTGVSELRWDGRRFSLSYLNKLCHAKSL